MRNSRKILAFVLVLVAALLWAGVFFFTRAIHAAEDARLVNVSETELAGSEGSNALKLRSLARDTKDLRDELDTLVSVDVLSAADSIESVGDVAGVKITIGSALPESSVEGQNAHVKVVGFLVESEGSLSALLRAVSLFEVLPRLSVVENAEFERVEGGNNWRLATRIRVVTSGDIQI